MIKHTGEHLPSGATGQVATHEKQPTATREHQPARSHEERAQSHHEALSRKTEEHYKAETEEAHRLAATEKQHREREPQSQAEHRREPIKVDEEFTHTMVAIQQEMSPAQRAFSRFIHKKPVEITSDFLASTVVRPNAMLAGSICAFVLMLAVYLFTKSIGYVLSGFELIATFVIGWVLGMIYDYARTMFNNR